MNKKIEKYKLIPLSIILKKKFKNEKFRKAFDEELSRLKLAHEIKLLRQERKMTQREVAEKAAMPQSVIARIESGTHSFSLTTVDRIAKVFQKEIGLVEQTSNRR